MTIFHKDIWKNQIKDALTFWVYLPVLVLGSGKLLDTLAVLPSITKPLSGLVLIMTGALLIWRATADLTTKGHGTPNPFRPPKILVTTGVYALCRHPMWFGYDLMALGCILLLGSLGSLLFSYPIFLAGQIFTLRKEEKILTLKYTEQYRTYQNKTTMLLPLPCFLCLLHLCYLLCSCFYVLFNLVYLINVLKGYFTCGNLPQGHDGLFVLSLDQIWLAVTVLFDPPNR